MIAPPLCAQRLAKQYAGDDELWDGQMLDEVEELDQQAAVEARAEATSRLRQLGFKNPPVGKKSKGTPSGADTSNGLSTVRLQLQLKTGTVLGREITATNVHYSCLGAPPVLARPPRPRVQRDPTSCVCAGAVSADDLLSEMSTVDLSNCGSRGTTLRAYLEHLGGEVREAIRFQDDTYALPPIPAYDIGLSLVPKGQKKAYFEDVTSKEQFELEVLRGGTRIDGAKVTGI